MKKNAIVVIIVACSIFAMGVYSYHAGKQKEKIEFKDSLDQVAVTVDDMVLSIRDMAFYVAYEEQTVENQALIYNSEDTNSYWNLHINGEFMKVTARHAAMNMAVHDAIFYEMAMAEDTELTAEEQELLESKQSDFWADLPEEAVEALGVSQESIFEVMRKMAVAQKYQIFYAQMQGTTYEDFDFEGEAYQKLLEEHEVKINENIWNRLDFGNITLDHY